MKSSLLLISSVVCIACSHNAYVGDKYADNSEVCKKQANQYVLTHRIDKLWRSHEFSRQYKICMRQGS